MALQSPFFGKKEPETFNNPRYGSTGSTPSSLTGNSTATPVAAEPVPTTSSAPSAAKEGGSQLTVGPNIKLKGVEITDCDTLVVEGLVEATMDSRVIQISQQGAFKGSAEIDIAEIHGVFEGNLTVRQKLVIYSTGKVSGKIRYGKVVIEEGGQLSGEIQATPSAASSSTAAKPVAPAIKTGLQAVA